MNKANLTRKVAISLNMPQVHVKKVINQCVQEIQATLGRGEKVTITGFGRFSAKKMPPRTRRNPKTGAKVAVAETISIRFNPSRKAKQSLAKIFEQRSSRN
ncbi:HU family DNA-binding protein [bacterium]|nr:HU family DNA-binding protein [bacterium]